ncbi:MAG: anti-sigma factor family protein [Deltaproteobacteria bacterium]
MAKLTRLTAEQRENLTAYLDGELDETATQEIEQVLAVSEVARHEVDMLSRAWDMLNVLPTHKASEEFTQRTMTSLRAAEHAGPSAAGELVYRHARRGVVLALWAGMLVLCGYAGFMATNHWVPNESEQLLDDYDVISNLDKYRDIGDIEFLKELQSRRTFSDHAPHDDQPDQ